MTAVLGWDIGGANVKAALVETGLDRVQITTASRPFEIWKDKSALPAVMQAVASELGPPARTAVTMTAELSDAFRTKREGVGFVLDAALAVSPAPWRSSVPMAASWTRGRRGPIPSASPPPTGWPPRSWSPVMSPMAS